MAGGSNLTDVQALNLRTVYDVVRLDGPISRAEIARRLDLAVPTISNIVRSLLDKGLLYEAPGPQGGRGKRPIALQVRADGGFAIGLNVDRDRLDGVITDLVGTTRHRVQRAIGQAHPDEVLPHLQDMHEELLNVEGIPRDRIWGTGVAVPGPLHARDAMIEAAGDLFELPGWTGVDVHARLAERLGEPVAIENHAVAAAIGETWWGTGQRLDSFFLVYFGLYLGGAAVVNGTVARGATGFANEFGSIPVPTAGGAYAPLGTLVSLAALLEHLHEAGVSLREVEELGDLVSDGNETVLAWLDGAADRLAPALATIECLLDPEAILFGERFPEPLVRALIDRLEVRMPSFAVPYKPRRARLGVGRLGGDAAATGAATLPLYRALHPDVFVAEAIGGSGRRNTWPTIL